MIQVRSNVFETNSSSEHSIVVKKHSEYDYDLGYYFDEETGTLNLGWCDFEFGRSPFDILGTTMEKLPYFITTFGLELMSKIIKLNIPEVKEIKHNCHSWYGEDLIGGVDHQSVGVLPIFIKKNNLTIDEVLFNTRYIIVIDGDEFGIWRKLNEYGLIDKEAIIIKED